MIGLERLIVSRAELEASRVPGELVSDGTLSDNRQLGNVFSQLHSAAVWPGERNESTARISLL